MHRSRITLIVAVLCLSTRLVFAQNNNDLATSIDRGAAAVGLPAGDGVISPAEQSLQTVLSQEATAFENRITEFEQVSTQNAAWVNSLESTVQQFNQQTSSGSDAPINAQIVEQYGQNLSALQNQISEIPEAQSITQALGQPNAENPLTAAASDAYAEKIKDAFNEYNQERNAEEAAQVESIKDAFNEYNRARNAEESAQVEAINNAFQEYNRENAQKQGRDNLLPPDQQAMVDAVTSAIDDYLNQSNTKHKEIVKRRLKHLIEIMVPSQNLPINGYWRPRPYTTQTSGQCINTWGDNDGPGITGPNDNPGEPLCGYANAGKLPFLTWHGATEPYLPGTSSMYGRQPVETTYAVKNSKGQTVRSVKVSTFTEYEVISPTQIRVHMFMQEEGGCTMNANYILELVTADAAVCPAMGELPIPEPTPVVEEPPPQTTGPYTVAQPLVSDETQCNDSNALPTLDEINLFEQSDGTIKLDYGFGSQILYSSGRDFYEYDSGRATDKRELINLLLQSDHASGLIFWSIRSMDGTVCSASMDFALPGSEALTSQSSNNPSSNAGEPAVGNDTAASTLTLVSGNYTVTWQPIPGTECSETVQVQLPKFTAATITTSGSGFILEAENNEYALVSQSGQFMYTAPGDDGSMEYMGIYGSDENGHLTGIFSRSLADGSTCISTIDLAPA